MNSMSESIDISISEKTAKYEDFVNEVLRNDLKKVLKTKEFICQQIANYLQIKSVIKGIQEKSFIESDDKPLKVQSDIGSNFYVECVVPDPKKIFVYTGMGFYVEFTLEEALRFIDKKESLLNEELIELDIKSSKIKANIKLVLKTIAQINQL